MRRASTSSAPATKQGADGRDKPGHDVDDAAIRSIDASTLNEIL
jgi:hypothetical protein